MPILSRHLLKTWFVHSTSVGGRACRTSSFVMKNEHYQCPVQKSVNNCSWTACCPNVFDRCILETSDIEHKRANAYRTKQRSFPGCIVCCLVIDSARSTFTKLRLGYEGPRYVGCTACTNVCTSRWTYGQLTKLYTTCTLGFTCTIRTGGWDAKCGEIKPTLTT